MAGESVTFITKAQGRGKNRMMKLGSNQRLNTEITLSRREGLNLRPTVYETVALPLSYAGSII